MKFCFHERIACHICDHIMAMNPSVYEEGLVLLCCVADDLEALQRYMSWVHPLQHIDSVHALSGVKSYMGVLLAQ